MGTKGLIHIYIYNYLNIFSVVSLCDYNIIKSYAKKML